MDHSLENRIRERAYEIWASHGYVHGEADQHWLEREKAALHYADLFKQGEHSIDKDEVYTDLAKHFSDEEIIELGLFCAEVDGVGKFVKSLNVLSWEEACELNPKLNAGATPVAAE